MQHIFLGLLISLLGVTAFGSSNPVLSKYKVINPSPETLRVISDKWEIVGREGNVFEVIIPANQATQLSSLQNTGLELLEADTSAMFHNPLLRSFGYFDAYRNFDQVTAYIKTLAQDYPNIVQLSEYGQSTDGRPLYVLKISDDVATDEAEPKIMLDAATHGDEIITVEVLLGIVDEIVKGYGTNQRLTNFVNNTELYFIPVVNPDGFSARQRYADGVDPNREYPWPEQTERRPIGIISDLIEFTNQHHFDGSLTFHAYGELIMYPWGFSQDVIGEQTLKTEYEQLSQKMAAANHYRTGQISKVMYIAKGSSSDYYLWKNNTFSIAIEIATNKAPHSAKIPEVTTQSKEMTYSFIEHFIDGSRFGR
ncbi:MAG: M14 family zinc carboxypeptidase [Oligoflexales bacterium]